MTDSFFGFLVTFVAIGFASALRRCGTRSRLGSLTATFRPLAIFTAASASSTRPSSTISIPIFAGSIGISKLLWVCIGIIDFDEATGIFVVAGVVADERVVSIGIIMDAGAEPRSRSHFVASRLYA